MEKQKITGSEALLKSLIAEGVDTIFGYPGGQAIPIYDSLYDYRDKLKHVLVRHSQWLSKWTATSNLQVRRLCSPRF